MGGSTTLPAPTGTPYRIAFVCLGNICRSPMADVIMSALLDEAGLAAEVEVTSCGTGTWHLGEPMDPRAAARLESEGYDASRHRAQKFDDTWLGKDLVLAMDAKNLAEISNGTGVSERVRMFRSFDPATDGAGDLDVPDPFYGEDDHFGEVIRIVERTCRQLLTEIQALEL